MAGSSASGDVVGQAPSCGMKDLFKPPKPPEPANARLVKRGWQDPVKGLTRDRQRKPYDPEARRKRYREKGT